MHLEKLVGRTATSAGVKSGSFSSIHSEMGDTGCEHLVDSTAIGGISVARGAESGASAAQAPASDISLRTIIDAWPALSIKTKLQIISLARKEWPEVAEKMDSVSLKESGPPAE
jgi:hypothetical protein